MHIILQRFEWKIFLSTVAEKWIVEHTSNLKSLSLLKKHIFIYLNIICRSIDIKYHKYNYLHLKSNDQS